MKNLTLPYWGRISHIVGHQETALFLCQRRSQLYRLDFNKSELFTHDLPTSMTAMSVMTDDTVMLLGDDGLFYQTDFTGKKAKALSKTSTFELMDIADDKKPHAVAMTNRGDLLLVLYPEHLLAWRYDKNKLGAFIGAFPQATPATALALSDDGKWLVVGDSSGAVTSYQDDGSTLVLSSSESLHTGDVTVLAFEPKAQQFFSAGADKQLLRTHVQGKLQGIDRAKASGHSQMVRALWVNDKRLYTGSDDKTVKTWQFDKGQPTTAKGDLNKVKALAQIHHLEQDCLVVVGTDESLRLIPLDKDGKATEVSHVIKDGYQRLQNDLSGSDDDFKEGLLFLEKIKDNQAFELVKTALAKTTDGFRREALTAWVASTNLNKTESLLLELMAKNSHEKVRAIAFDALKERVSSDKPVWTDLNFLQTAIDCKFVDICRLAIAEYARLAKAYVHLATPITQTLQSALTHSLPMVRRLALAELENLLPDGSPQADLWALSANDSDIIQAGLIRLYQRDLLGSLEVKRQIALLQNSNNLQVRQTALYVAILSEPALADALKHSDDNFTLTLQDFADFRLQNDGKGMDLGLGGAFALDNKAKKGDKPTLGDAVLEPLLQGLGNAYDDISFRSAYALALLGDERALGTLLRLMAVDDDNIRLGVAKALGELGAIDGLAVLPILLNDKNSAVRLSAFNAYQKLASDDLLTISTAMQSHEEDIHQKALALLLKCSQGKKITKATVALLTQTLNNPFASVRQEVVKVLINHMADKGLDETLSVLTQSSHGDVHQVALDLWQAKVKEPTTELDSQTDILVQFLANPFANIRQASLNFAHRENKRFSTKVVIETAFASKFVDVRKQGLELLNTHKSPELLELVVALINDEDHELRLHALTVALGFGDVSILKDGLSSPYDDIRLASAKALAKVGDPSSFDVLEEFLQRPAPKDRPKDEITLWSQNITSALTGLALLGDSRGFAYFKVFFDGNSEYQFLSMAEFLAYVVSADDMDDLAKFAQSDRQNLRDGANLALAIWGDERGRAIFGENVPPLYALQAHNGLGIRHAYDLQKTLTHDKTTLASVLLLIFSDLCLGSNTPTRLLEALALVNGEWAVLLAGVIARYHDRDGVWDYVATALNDGLNSERKNAHDYQKRETPWGFTAKTLQELARFALLAPATVQASTVDLLTQINAKHTFNHWQSHWTLMTKRYADVVLPMPEPSVDTTNDKQRQAVAFGSLLGIIRTCDYRSVATGLKGLRELASLAQSNHTWQDGTIRAMLSFLNHDDYLVRDLSWDLLQTLGADTSNLAQTAIRSSYDDMIRRGLDLWLSVDGSADKLADFLATSSPDLANETYDLLVKKVGKLQAGMLALDAYHLPLRRQAINEWYYADDVAEQLTISQKAVQNDDWWTAFNALQILLDVPSVNKADYLDRAFEFLQSGQDYYYARWQLLPLITRHYKDGVAARLLTLLDTPNQKLNTSDIYEEVGDLRDVSVVDSLLERYTQKTSERLHIVKALVAISGFDQYIEDYDDESGDKRWLDRQYPRHTDVLLKLMSLALNKAHYPDFMGQLRNLAWVADEQYQASIDELFIQALKQLPSDHSAKIASAMSYRAEKRGGDLSGLRVALSNKDPEVQFIGAEGLAKCGIKDGFAVLMATVDHNSDYHLRRRAVLALGHLADENAYDKLLKLAEDGEHALQDVASEALGHLGQGEHGQQIFKLLEKCIKGDRYGDNPALEHWLNGLRYLNTPQSWQLIRQVISERYDASFGYDDGLTDGQLHAIKLLKHHDDPANRELLLQLLRHQDDQEVVETAHSVASVLWGGATDVVYEYDWATLGGHYPLVLQRVSLTRVVSHASLDELVAFIMETKSATQALNAEVLAGVSGAILRQTGLPKATLETLLSDDGVTTQQIALQYLTQHPSDYWSKAVQTQITKQLQQLQGAWGERLTLWQKDPNRADSDTQVRQELSALVSAYLWLLLRYGSDKATTNDTLSWLLTGESLAINQALPSVAYVHNVWLRQALLALTARDDDMVTACRDVLAGVSSWATTELGELATVLIAKADSKGKSWTTELGNLAKSLMGKGTSQKQATPHAKLLAWVQAGDISALFDMANDKGLDEALRISAIEGLGQLNAPEVAERLLTIKDTDPDTDIQKSAFSALRRYQRRQASLAKLAALSATTQS